MPGKCPSSALSFGKADSQRTLSDHPIAQFIDLPPAPVQADKDFKPKLRDMLVEALKVLPSALANDPIFVAEYLQSRIDHFQRNSVPRGSNAMPALSAPSVQSSNKVQGQPSSATFLQVVQGQNLSESQQQLSSVQRHSLQPQSLSQQPKSVPMAKDMKSAWTSFDYQSAQSSSKSAQTSTAGPNSLVSSLIQPPSPCSGKTVTVPMTEKLQRNRLCKFCFRGPHEAKDCHNLRVVVGKLLLMDCKLKPQDVYEALVEDEPHPSKAIAAFMDNPADFMPPPRRRKHLQPWDDDLFTSSYDAIYYGWDNDQLISTDVDFNQHFHRSS